MKKLIGLLGISLVIFAGILAYYSFIGFEEPVSSDTQIVVTPVVRPEVTSIPKKINRAPEPKAYEENVVEAEEVALDEDEIVEPEIEPIEVELETHNEFSYSYDQLSDAGKELYDVLYQATVSYEENAPVPTTDTEALDAVFNCVMNDHPEIFYVNGYRYTKYTQAGVLKRLAFTASYCYTEAEKNQIEPVLESVENQILEHVIPTASDYDKIKFIYEVIVNNTEYDLESTDNQNIISVLCNGRSVCQGYAKTFQILLNKMGIPCTLVTGVVSSGERHAWNVCKADGEWYYVDVTWGDASYQMTDSKNSVFIPDVNYDYLLVTSAEIDETHKSDTPVSMPYTQAIADNYYVKEGLYLIDYNPNQLAAIFDNYRAMGKQAVALKCADNVVYGQVRSELIDNQKIFDYIKTGQSRYQDDASQRKLVFALQ